MVDNSCIFQNVLSSLDFSFFELFLSTFLGFWSALLVEAIVNKHNEKEMRKQLLDNLRKELLFLSKEIDFLEKDKVYIRPYPIPIWTGACECGSILCMDKESYFPKLVEVFSCIEEGNLIEMKCFELCVTDVKISSQELIFSTLTNNREHIKEQIAIGLDIMKGGIK